MLKKFAAAVFAAWMAFAYAQPSLNQVTGAITTQNLVAAGDCTPGSCVEIDVTGIASVTVQTKGTYTGALSAQVTTNRKDWVTECSSSCTSTFTRRTTGVATATITSGQEDIYQVQFANGAKRLRITGLAAVTGTANITIQPSNVGAGSSSSASALTDAELRATPVPVSGTVTASGPLTDAQLRATAVPVSGTVSITANSAVNVAQINGVTTTMGNGISGTGVQRVTIASDSTGQVALAAGTATIGALTANQSVNVAQMNGTNVSMGSGVNGTGVQRITLATDDSIFGVAHDAAASTINPSLVGCYSSAAAPADVSADIDATRIWCLRNGALATTPTFAGVLPSTGLGNSGAGVQRVAVAAYSGNAIVTLTRTADTAIYAANDVLGAATGSTAALTFPSICPLSAGRIKITSVSLQINDTGVISGETSYKLYLYNVTPPSALGDNAAFDLPSGDRTAFLGFVDLGTVLDLGSTLFVQTSEVNRQVTCSGTSLFGYLVTTGGYTPTASRVYVVTLNAVGL